MIIQAADKPLYHKKSHIRYTYDLGECFIHNSLKFAYVGIPKNASTHIGYYIQATKQFTNSNFLNENLNNYKFIVILRDPLERWISGISECVYKNYYEIDYKQESFLNYIFNEVQLDRHTEYQVNYLQGLDTNNCIFFNLDTNFSGIFQNFIRDNLYLNPIDTSKYEYSEDGFKSQFYTFLNEQILKNNSLKQKIIDYYKPDYDLISQIKFCQ